MNPDPILLTVQPSPEFKDRRSGLIVFGIFEILFGALAGLMVLLMVLGRALAAQAGQEQMPLSSMIPSALVYLLVAVVLIALGIGSCQTRRWARVLSLIVAWSWLIVGIATMLMMGFYLPKILNASQAQGQKLPEGALGVILVFTLFLLSVLVIVVPGILILFYRSRHVKATCEARDPAPGWADACPLRVLGMSLWLGFGAVTLLAMPLSTHGVFPAFGRLHSGVGGAVFYLVLAALWGYSAWAVYRLRELGWWIALISVCLMSASAWITFTRIDLVKMYQLMGYSQQQIDLIKQYSFIQGHGMAYLSVASAVPMLAFLLFVKRDFRRATQEDPLMPS